MKLTDADVGEFRSVYKTCYDEELPEADARMWAVRLARLYRLLLRPTPMEAAARLAKSDSRGTVEKPTETNALAT